MTHSTIPAPCGFTSRLETTKTIKREVRTVGNFKILDHLDRLTLDGGSQGKNESSHHCPVCNATNFKVTHSGPKEGQYFTYGCDCMATDAGKQRVIDAISPRWEKPIRAADHKPFDHHDRNGDPIVRVTRKDDGKGWRDFPTSHYSGERWISGIPEEIKAIVPLYRIFDRINQDAIAKGERILVPEGHGKVDSLIAMGIPATCSIGGGGRWNQYGHANYVADLGGAAVVICPDRDVPGLKHANQIALDFPDAEWLYADPTSFEWDRVPKDKGFDVGDWIREGATKEQILEAIEPRRVITEETLKPINQRLNSDNDGDEKPQRRAIADQLIDIGRTENITYFVTPEEDVYADVVIDETRSTLAIREKLFKQYLRSIQFDNTGKSPGSEAVQQAIDTLEALAVRKAEKRSVHVRLADHEGRIYIDLADESWQAIEVSRDGWRSVSDAPVRFIRGASAPLPMPIDGGRVEDFKDLCQFDDDTWILILAFLLQALKPEKGYPILLLHGGPEAGKSTITRAFKQLVDPSPGKPRKHVGDVRDFAIHATRRHCIAIDNLSGLSTEQSDILCTSSTGGGHSQRTLHSDSGETLFNFTNLLILNGIDSIATRGDLLSRSFPVTIHPPKNRLSESQFEEHFEALRPGVMGGLLTILSKILAILPSIKGSYTGNRERFVGFVELGLALEQVMEWKPGTFLRVLGETRDEAHETAIESSPVGQAIQDFMLINETWTGTMAGLLSQLKLQVSEQVARSKFFPHDSTRLSKNLIRLSPDLRALGIGVETRKSNGVKFITLVRTAKLATLATLTASINIPNLDAEQVIGRVASHKISDPVQYASDPSDPVQKFSDPVSDPAFLPSDPVSDPALNACVERVSENQYDNRVARVAKNGANSSGGQSDLGVWEFDEWTEKDLLDLKTTIENNPEAIDALKKTLPPRIIDWVTKQSA